MFAFRHCLALTRYLPPPSRLLCVPYTTSLKMFRRDLDEVIEDSEPEREARRQHRRLERKRRVDPPIDGVVIDLSEEEEAFPTHSAPPAPSSSPSIIDISGSCLDASHFIVSLTIYQTTVSPFRHPINARLRQHHHLLNPKIPRSKYTPFHYSPSHCTTSMILPSLRTL